MTIIRLWFRCVLLVNVMANTRQAVDDSTTLEQSGLIANIICGDDNWIHLTLATETSSEPFIEMDLSLVDNVIECHDDDITVIEDIDTDRSGYGEIVEIMKTFFVGKRFYTSNGVENALGNMLYEIVRIM